MDKRPILSIYLVHLLRMFETHIPPCLYGIAPKGQGMPKRTFSHNLVAVLLIELAVLL